MKDIIKIFTEYAKKYDLTDRRIMGKFHHPFRVMEFCKEIAIEEGLSDEDIKLASIIGLFHDIGRFEQLKKYKTYMDHDSIDHGDLGYKILKDEMIDKITDNKEDKKIILTAVKNHNKYQIEDNLNEKELLMSKIIRDADKLDIMKEQGFIKENHKLNKKLIDILMNHKMIKNEDLKDEIDIILRIISFIFDLNFKYSYKYILDNNIIKNKVNLVEIYTDSDLQSLEDNLTNYCKVKIK